MHQVGVPDTIPSLAVAVSGGADSLALTLLAAEWCKQRQIHFTALTVDHELRPESCEEAHQVGLWLKAQGINHFILRWRHDQPTMRRLQERARQARYALLEEWCLDQGVAHLLLGHHVQDQQETIAMRILKETDVIGRGGMSAHVPSFRLNFYRPFLSTFKARLIATLKARSQSWIEDPSNQNPRFSRVRLRQSQESFPNLDAIRAYGVARQEVESVLHEEIERHVHFAIEGFARATFRELSPFTLRRLVQSVGGQLYPKRRDQIEDTLNRLIKAECPAFTMGGVLFKPMKNNQVLLIREPGLIEEQLILDPGAWRCWDRRFWLYHECSSPLTIKCLKVDEWSRVKSDLQKQEISLPWPVPLTLPAVYHNGMLLNVPSLRWSASNARISALNTLQCVFQPRLEPKPPMFKVI